MCTSNFTTRASSPASEQQTPTSSPVPNERNYPRSKKAHCLAARHQLRRLSRCLIIDAPVLPIARAGIIVPLRLRNNAGWNIGSDLGWTGTGIVVIGGLTVGGIELRARRRPGSLTVGAGAGRVIPRRRSGSRRLDEAPLGGRPVGPVRRR